MNETERTAGQATFESISEEMERDARRYDMSFTEEDEVRLS